MFRRDVISGSSTSLTKWTRWQLAGLSLAVVLHAAISLHGAAVHSPSWDEVGHLGAGLEHWQHGTFHAYKVNPPLVRMLAVLPLLLEGTVTVPKSVITEFPARPEWECGQAVIVQAGPRIFSHFTHARWMLLPWSLVGLGLCSHWARTLAGNRAAVCVAWMWAMDPSLLTASQLIVPDLCAASAGILLFWKLRAWLLSPSLSQAVQLGACLGIALLCKSSWLLALPLLPAIWLIWRGRLRPWRTFWSEVQHLTLAIVVAVVVLNLGYGWRGVGRPLGSFRFFSQPLRGSDVTSAGGLPSGNCFRSTWVSEVPCPLPAAFVEGVDFQRNEFERGYPSYLLGEHKHGGWWYFTLLTLLWKVPLGFWMVFGLGLLTSLRNVNLARRELLLLSLPPIVFLLAVCSQTGFSHHLRYALPVFPFGIVLASMAFADASRTSKLRTILATAGLLWGIASSLLATPHHLSYFNELVGGPAQGYHAAGLGGMDSLHDWQQDLLLLRDWVAEHPDRPLDGIATRSFPGLREAAGLTQPSPPSGELPGGNLTNANLCTVGPKPGRYVLTLKDVFLPESPYRYFQEFEPVGRIGYTLQVYEITANDAARVWPLVHGPTVPLPECRD